MELMEKQGYKETEVGLIPEDWEVGILEDMASKIGSGITPRGGVTVYKVEGRPFVRSQNIGWGSLKLDDIKFINDEIHSTFPNTEIKLNDVFLNISGASIGRSSFATKFLIGGNVNQHVCIIRSEEKKLNYLFLNKVLLSSIGQKQIDSFQSGGNREGLNIGQIRTFQIPLPPTLTEQKAIATALSDVDTLISSLEQTITKKKAIKQGAMQQLLTPPHKGGKRLPGFEGEWVEKTLGECLKYEQPTKYIVENSDYEGQSQTPVLTAGKSFLLGYTDVEFLVYYDYTVIFFDYFTTFKQFVDFSFKVKSSAMKLLKPVSDEIDINLIFSIMNLIRFSLGDDHKRRWIAEYSKIEIFMPYIKEQKAIAQILSEMDAEITQLESKKEKYQAIKQGMMQELLTGKTRLI